MKSSDLYQKLDTDFEIEKCRDDWANINFNKEFITANFRKRYMGILADNTDEIKKVYIAVFPSDKVMEEILSKKEKIFCFSLIIQLIGRWNQENFPLLI